MNGPLYMQASNNKALIRRVRKKGDGSLKSLCRWLVDNQTGLSFNLIAFMFLAHYFLPKARPTTSKFFTLGHYNPRTGQYANGKDDYYFISFCIVLFTGLRAGVMEYILAPLAKHWGISKRKDVVRFSEQAWMLTYYLVFWSLGVYIYANSQYWLNMEELWTNWPLREIDGMVKFYMLAQWSFWLQQVIVINIEERRKDHWQMFAHHIITISLVSSCYFYHHTRVGNLILVLMDTIDVILPLAKCLKYLGFTTICDAVFGLFVVSWFVTRHVLYPMTCWSVHKDVARLLPSQCYYGSADNLTGPSPVPDGWSYLLEPVRNPQGTVCFTDGIRWGFLSALLFLLGLTIVWFTMILKVVAKVLRGASADDIRSDGEEEDEQVSSEYVYEEVQPYEEEVGVEAIDLKGWERRTGVKRTTTATSVSLPGHSDRKELLNRIGCEKQIE